MKFIFTILLGSWFLCCSQIELAAENYIQLVVQMENKFEKRVHQKYGLDLIATGGQMMQNIKSLNLHFQNHGILSKDRMRILLVEITDSYLNEINNNIKVRPFLNSFPFTINNVDIAIFVENGNEEILYPNIAVGESNYGNISFNYVKTGIGPFSQTDSETFEEAKAIVESQK